MTTVEVEYDRVLKVSDKALLLEIDGQDVWVPKSLVENYENKGESNGYDAAPGTIEIADWFAEKEGLV